jgi:hypothetical protein
VYGPATAAPTSAQARDDYCTFTASVLHAYPAIGDLIVWVEPNRQTFWSPQFGSTGSDAAPAAYEALLSRCYPIWHQAFPSVNVVATVSPRGADGAPASTSHSPTAWIEQVGAAYRAQASSSPIFDTFGINVYPDAPSQPPTAAHPHTTSVTEGDYGKLVALLDSAFTGTHEPLPGKGLSIWYTEDGFQTAVDPSKQPLYHGAENQPGPLSPSAQAAQLQTAITLAYCQPDVTAFFNFMLVDDRSLTGWQSGLYWADLTPKPAAQAVAALIGQIDAGTFTCPEWTQPTLTTPHALSASALQQLGTLQRRLARALGPAGAQTALEQAVRDAPSPGREPAQATDAIAGLRADGAKLARRITRLAADPSGVVYLQDATALVSLSLHAQTTLGRVGAAAGLLGGGTSSAWIATVSKEILTLQQLFDEVSAAVVPLAQAEPG